MVYRWALAAVVLAHLVTLYLPGSAEPGPELVPHLDKVVHVLLFAAPVLLVRRVTTQWWPVALVALHAPLSEVVQASWVPHRSGDPWDLVADLAGIALGLTVARSRNFLSVRGHCSGREV